MYLENARLHSPTHFARGSFFALPLCTLRLSGRQCFIDISSRSVHNLCMMPIMVKEADLNRIEVPEDY